jgi:uracil-DNA glycosylase family 4
MGATELFLDGMSREEALRLLAAAREAADVPEERSGRPEPKPSSRRADLLRPQEEVRPAAAARKAPESSSPAAPAAAAAPTLPDSYEELRSLAMSCTRCGLCEGRTHVVFSDGPTDARIMVVGEAPGANEDETGIPFVGAAGKYLDLLLATVGLSRKESVYIANVLKCRPPGNRDPRPEEIEACSPFLRKQIDLVQPDALLAVGSFAGKLLTGQEKSSLGRLRGQVHSYHGVPLVVTYHPAALLRNANWTRAFWTDLQLLRDVMDADGGQPAAES